jgi:hypothetical protein
MAFTVAGIDGRDTVANDTAMNFNAITADQYPQ